MEKCEWEDGLFNLVKQSAVSKERGRIILE